MNRRILPLVASLALSASALFGATAASAQMYNGPVYEGWQDGWNNGNFDRHHVILGRVVGFQPYRIEIRRPNGNVQTVDLKNGTVIRPEGATPTPGMRVALIGYYSNGTFIVNRLIVR